jgi:hypothetical protein
LLKLDEIANRETYTSEEHGFEIKYPKSLKTDFSKPGNITIGAVPFEPGPGFVNIKVIKGKSLEETISEMKDNPAVYENFSQQEIRLNNLKEIKKHFKIGKVIYTGAFAGEKHNLILIERNNRLYEIRYIEGDNRFNQQISQILSTFRFRNLPQKNQTQSEEGSPR